MDKKEAYFEKLEAQLREWDAMWDVLKARLAKKGADVKLEGIELLKRLETTRGEAREKLAGLRRSADQNWDSFKSQADEALAYLSKGIETVRSKLKTSQDGPPGDQKPDPK
jgi:hypothetical protein